MPSTSTATQRKKMAREFRWQTDRFIEAHPRFLDVAHRIPEFIIKHGLSLPQAYTLALMKEGLMECPR